MPLINFSRAFALRLRGMGNPTDNGKFWIAQIFMLAATVAGVYLAATVGFDRALTFDQLTKQRTALNMLAALENEVESNNEELILTNQSIAKAHIGMLDKADISKWFSPSTYVWDAMTESPELFVISPEVINSVRSYYDDVQSLIVLLDDNHMHRIDYLKRMEALTVEHYNELQVLIKKDKERLGKNLK